MFTFWNCVGIRVTLDPRKHPSGARKGANVAACEWMCSHADHRLHAVSAAAAVAFVVVIVVVVRCFLVFASPLCVRQLVVLFPTHASVLEPHFDLPLAQAQRVRHFDAAAARQVAAEVELFLQLKDLLPRVSRPQTLWLRARVVRIN